MYTTKHTHTQSQNIYIYIQRISKSNLSEYELISNGKSICNMCVYLDRRQTHMYQTYTYLDIRFCVLKNAVKIEET